MMFRGLLCDVLPYTLIGRKANHKRGITLLELIIAISLLGVISIGVASIHSFSYNQLIGSIRRVQLQNELSFALEHIGKNVSLGVGNRSSIPVLMYGVNGFRVRVEHVPPTLGDLADDTIVIYTLDNATNNLTCSLNSEVLSSHILDNVSQFDVMPSYPNGSVGLYINTVDGGTAVEIGLVAKYRPHEATGLDNPQVSMKARFYTFGSAAK